MKVKCIKEYYDLELLKVVKVGDELDVSDTRAKALTTTKNKMGVVLCEADDKVVKQRKTKKED